MDRASVLRRLPFWVVLLAVYYILPLCDSTVSGRFLQLIGFLPGLTFVVTWIYGVVNRFSWIFCTAAVILAFPVMFLFFDSSTWFIPLVYGAIAFVGCFLGGLWKKNK